MNLVDIVVLVWLGIWFSVGAQVIHKVLGLISWLPGLGLLSRLLGGILGTILGAAIAGIAFYYAALSPEVPNGLQDAIASATIASWLQAFGGYLVTLWE